MACPEHRQGSTNGYYVVFKGKKPGIYTSWIDCYSQIERFSASAYRFYPTFGATEAAWVAYSSHPSNERIVQDQHMCHAGGSSLTGNDLAVKNCFVIVFTHLVSYFPNVEEGELQIEFVEDMPSNYFVMEYSMQTLLHQVCSILRIVAPTYTRHDMMVNNGQTYYRYYASLKTGLIGIPLMSMGRYASTEDKAREDVAVLLLRRLVACSGCRISDFNFHNISVYEQHISLLEVENFGLIMENAQLKPEIKSLKRTLNT